MATEDVDQSGGTDEQQATSGSETSFEQTEATTGTGLESNVAGALSYLFGAITGVVFYVLEPDDEFVRFHASQSIVLSVGFFAFAILTSLVTTVLSVGAFGTGANLVFSLVSLVISLVWLLLSLGAFVLWLFLMLRAYQGKKTRVPVVAGLADRIA